jgi:SAM-dependent methyltransferase
MNQSWDRRALPHRAYSYDAAAYTSPSLRGVEDPRPWQIRDVIARHLQSHHTILDVGCGTATKTMELARQARRMIGVEPSPSMRAAAMGNATGMGITNFSVVAGYSQELPLADGSVDVLSSIMSPPDASEFGRVLRKGGVAVVECLGERDKYNVTVEFGRDERGLRGLFIECAEGERLAYLTEQFAAHFSDVETVEGRWRTRFSIEGLVLLLEQTPTVRGFDRARDAAALRRVAQHHGGPDGIETYQHRVLVVARK